MFQIRLKELREERGLSQNGLAQLIGVRQSTVAMWENGTNRPVNSKLLVLSEFFGVSIDYLLGVSDDKTSLEPKESDIDEEKLKFALFGGDGEITDEMFDEVKRYAQFIKERKKNGGA